MEGEHFNMEKRKEMWRALPFVMALLLLTLVPAQSASALFGKSKEEVKAARRRAGGGEHGDQGLPRRRV